MKHKESFYSEDDVVSEVITKKLPKARSVQAWFNTVEQLLTSLKASNSQRERTVASWFCQCRDFFLQRLHLDFKRKIAGNEHPRLLKLLKKNKCRKIPSEPIFGLELDAAMTKYFGSDGCVSGLYCIITSFDKVLKHETASSKLRPQKTQNLVGSLLELLCGLRKKKSE